VQVFYLINLLLLYYFFGDAGDTGINTGDLVAHTGTGDATHATTGTAAANLFAEYGGIDPHRDPELAFAMKESIEAEKQRKATESSKTEKPVETPATESEKHIVKPDADMSDITEEEKLLLEEALMMSNESKQEVKKIEKPAAIITPKPDVSMEGLTEEEQEQMRIAMELSAEPSIKQNTNEEGIQDAINDPEFLSSLLSNLPGVDPADARIKGLLQELSKKDDKKDDKKDGNN